jgi:hypothetical protein
MKPPRFGLRSLFLLIALLSVLAAWAAAQFNWIRQRHAVLSSRKIYEAKQYVITGLPAPLPNRAPWSLRLFGEAGQADFLVNLPESDLQFQRIRELFPEARVQGMFEQGDGFQ